MDEEDGEHPGHPDDPVGSEEATEVDELSRMIEAGASSPEELRALAERLRQQREQERSQWREEVRPGLMRSKRKRPSLSDLRGDAPQIEPDHEVAPSTSEVRWLALGAILVALVLVALAAQSTVWLLLLPIAGVLGYAWWYGQQGTDDQP